MTIAMSFQIFLWMTKRTYKNINANIITSRTAALYTKVLGFGNGFLQKTYSTM